MMVVTKVDSFLTSAWNEGAWNSWHVVDCSEFCSHRINKTNILYFIAKLVVNEWCSKCIMWMYVCMFRGCRWRRRRSMRRILSARTWRATSSKIVSSTYCHVSLKPGFHSNAIACVGKQPIMVATASTEHSYWLALAFVAWKLYL